MDDPSLLSALAEYIELTRTDDKAHFQQLGNFVIAYSNAEGMVHVLARKMSGLTDEKARILFAGMRLGDVIDRLRQFMRLDKINEETYSEVDSCLTQLAHISDLRHKLVHRGAAYFAGSLVVSNSMTSKSPASGETDIIDVFRLREITDDSGTIFLRLSLIAQPDKTDATLVAQLKARPWRYTHVPPKPPNQKRRGTPEEPPPPPDASRK